MKNGELETPLPQPGLPAALLLNVDEKQKEPGRRKPEAGSDDEKQILKDLAEFNRRLAALRRWRGSGQD
jgi:hypothetical protein